MNIFKKTRFMLLPMIILALQFSVLSSAHAVGDSDLRLVTAFSASNQGLKNLVCNDGPSDIVQFDLDYTLSNWAIQDTFILPFNTTNSTQGTLNTSTLVWTGVLESTKCIEIGTIGDMTVPTGQTGSIDVEIVSAELAGNIANVDPNPGNESWSSGTITAVNKPDLEISTRLKTTGVISPSTVATYEVTIANNGVGKYFDNGFFIFAFIMPDGSTLDSATDPVPGDSVTTNGACQQLGNIASLGFSALSSYTGSVVVCNLVATNGMEPGVSAPIDVNIVAGSTFASGQAEVIGIIQGDDADTLKLAKSISTGVDPFLDSNDNLFRLTYDPNALRATVSRCPGQGATTTDGKGCFRVTFNKLIYAPEFTASDIDLGGVGSVDTFTQLNDFTWEIRIKDIPPGKTASLKLALNSVVDYSAVLNDVQVLGENTIRFEVLPATGSHVDYVTPLVLLLFGFVLVKAMRDRTATV